jgi:hypothetical protein
MAKWKSCQHLWKNDLPKLIETLKDKAPSHAKFEEMLTNYNKAARSVLSEAGDADLDWIRVDNRPLAHAVHKEATELAAAVAFAMREIDIASMNRETAYIQELREVINKEPESLEVRFVVTCG